jgi:transcriptional regulator with XRE-family HTH domain
MELDTDKLVKTIRWRLNINYAETGKNMSFDVASEQIGISKPTLSRVLQGKMPEVNTFIKICAWLGIETDSFVKHE